ncbi:MAG: nuclear transport factor 2 family protein [Pseudomonadaceae bacterium]|nr:nuclear transport factor 2 family protein [Pseudomonadaceae bacterium]
MVNLDIAETDNERRALELFKAMEDGDLPDKIRALCTDDFVWANSGLKTLAGQQAIFDQMAVGGFSSQIPILKTMTHFSADILYLASRGEIVFSERIDHHWDADGRDLMTPHIAGVMEFRNGKICALRDFYDTACYEQEPTQSQPGFSLAEWTAR